MNRGCFVTDTGYEHLTRHILREGAWASGAWLFGGMDRAAFFRRRLRIPCSISTTFFSMKRMDDICPDIRRPTVVTALRPFHLQVWSSRIVLSNADKGSYSVLKPCIMECIRLPPHRDQFCPLAAINKIFTVGLCASVAESHPTTISLRRLLEHRKVLDAIEHITTVLA